MEKLSATFLKIFGWTRENVRCIALRECLTLGTKCKSIEKRIKRCWKPLKVSSPPKYEGQLKKFKEKELHIRG